MSLTDKLSNLTMSDALTDEEKALESQWATLSKKFPEGIDKLNDELKYKTYILGNKPAEIDVALFKTVLPIARGYTSADYASKRHILRWVDLIQHTLVTSEEKLAIDFSVEVPREVKEKKEKKEAAAPAAGKAPAKAPAKEEKKPRGKPDEETLKKLREEAAKAKKEKKAKANAEAAAKAKAEAVPPNPSMIEFKIGFIEKAVKHPDADSLYVSTINCGEDEPRTVCSGLVKYVPLEDMQKRYVVLVSNFKPVTMRGIKSTAMVLCASTKNNPDAEEVVEFVNPPAGSQPGDKVFFEGFDGVPEKVLNPKKKIWEQVQPSFSTNDKYEVIYKQEGKPDARLVNAKGEVFKNSTIVGAHVS